MKRASCIAVTLLTGLIGNPVFAQSGVTMYGIADVAVEYSNGGANSFLGGTPKKLYEGQSGVRVTSGVNSGSRLGFRGVEDLGGGMKAIFQIEHQMLLDTGTQSASQFWNRQAFVGLETPWGRLTMGRQYSPVYTVLQPIDATAYRFYDSWDKFVSVQRFDNSVEYRTPRLGGLMLNAMYAFGENLTPSAGTTPPYDLTKLRSGDYWGVGARWASGAFSISGAYQTYSIRTQQAGYYVKNPQEWGVGASYKFGSTAHIGLGYLVNNNNLALLTAPNSQRNDIVHYLLSGSINLGPGRLYLNYIHLAPEGGKDSDRIGLSYEWLLSNRTSVYTSLGYDQNYSYGISGSGVTAVNYLADRQYFALGIRHLF